MQIGKLKVNRKGWFWDGMRMKHPILILTGTFIGLPLYYFSRALYCLSILISNFDWYDVVQAWKSTK